MAVVIVEEKRSSFEKGCFMKTNIEIEIDFLPYTASYGRLTHTLRRSTGV